MPRSVKLTDAELTAVMSACHPLALSRDAFLQQVAGTLKDCHELGDGVVHRVIAQAQREFFNPPDLSRGKASLKRDPLAELKEE
jgi:hypothetical protein